jgi:DNA polymerase
MAVKNNDKTPVTSWIDWVNSIEPFRGDVVFASIEKGETTSHSEKQLEQTPPIKKERTSITIPSPVESETSEKEEVDISSLSLEFLIDEVNKCSRCNLAKTRNKGVPGEGDKDASLMFIGEGPGYDEDKSGRPFVGKAGQLLTKIIESGLGISRKECYIANIVKCRPPQNRDPFENEAAACIPYLHRQIELIKPKMIVVLGRVAMNYLLGITPPLKVARAQNHSYKEIPVVVTYHPAALLRNPALKKDVWSDLQVVIKELDLPGAN